jgi:hypothetical protein
MIIVRNAGHNWRQVGEPIESSKREPSNIMFQFAEKIERQKN